MKLQLKSSLKGLDKRGTSYWVVFLIGGRL